MFFRRKYKVNYANGIECFRDAKEEYREGEAVELVFHMIATDTDYSFVVEGCEHKLDYESGRGYVIRFTMPANDVTVRVFSRNSMTVEKQEWRPGW